MKVRARWPAAIDLDPPRTWQSLAPLSCIPNRDLPMRACEVRLLNPGYCGPRENRAVRPFAVISQAILLLTGAEV
jgi:hypothetical protein